MIARLRKRFILITMAAMFTVLCVIVGAINIASYINTARQADQLLSFLAENDGRFPKPFQKDDQFRHPGRGMSPEAPYDTRFFTVTLVDGTVSGVNTGNIAAIAADDAMDYALTIWEKGKTQGYQGDYRYLVTQKQDGKTLILFLDHGRERSAFRIFLMASILASLAGMLAVFVLVLLLSKRAVKPLMESYEKQKQFITDAGHEIKTPLTVIDANTEVLEIEQGENQWTQSIRGQIKRLAQLTNSLVALSRMDEEGAPLVMTEFSLSDAVTESVEPFGLLAQKNNRRLELSVEPNISYHGNEEAFRQLVGILADNAVKYAQGEGPIVFALQRNGRAIELRCTNPAEGIAVGDHDILFERFYRRDASRSRQTGGYGLGLSLAKGIVQAHRGKIHAASPDGASLTMTVTL